MIGSTVRLGHEIDRRIPYDENTVDDILNYGYDNAYPQRMKELMGRSSSTEAAVSRFAKFIRGNGFVDQVFGQTIINSAGHKIRDLLRMCIMDYAIWRGFALRINYNAFLSINSVYYLPFDWVRFSIPQTASGIIKTVAVHPDWLGERNQTKTFNKDLIQEVDMFNPDPDVVRRQIREAGSLAKYKGQILYYTPEMSTYPTASFDAIQEDVDTDARISRFKNSNVKNKFMASHIIEYPGEFEGDDERAKFINNLSDFQGDEEAGNLFVIENAHEDKRLQLHPVAIQDNDRLFEWHEESVKNNIRRHYMQPPVLGGELTPGRLGGAAELQDAFAFYNSVTTDDRNIFEEKFRDVFSGFRRPINPSENYLIDTLTFQNGATNPNS